MTIKEFLTKLNSLAKYALGVANSDRGKLEVFLGKLIVDITKDVLMGDTFPKYFLKVVGRL